MARALEDAKPLVQMACGGPFQQIFDVCGCHRTPRAVAIPRAFEGTPSHCGGPRRGRRRALAGDRARPIPLPVSISVNSAATSKPSSSANRATAAFWASSGQRQGRPISKGRKEKDENHEICAHLDGDPAVIVLYDNDQTWSFEKTADKGWREEPKVYRDAKVMDKADWDKAFPDAGMPTLPHQEKISSFP